MKIKTSELIGSALDWAVALCEGRREPELMDNFAVAWFSWGNSHYSTNWAMGGPIIDEKGITVIRLDNRSIPDSKGFWTGKYEPQWGASAGGGHSTQEVYGAQGDFYGECYQVNADAVVGPTSLIAAMRCYVASKMGDEVDVPEELL